MGNIHRCSCRHRNSLSTLKCPTLAHVESGIDILVNQLQQVNYTAMLCQVGERAGLHATKRHVNTVIYVSAWRDILLM